MKVRNDLGELTSVIELDDGSSILYSDVATLEQGYYTDHPSVVALAQEVVCRLEEKESKSLYKRDELQRRFCSFMASVKLANSSYLSITTASNYWSGQGPYSFFNPTMLKLFKLILERDPNYLIPVKRGFYDPSTTVGRWTIYRVTSSLAEFLANIAPRHYLRFPLYDRAVINTVKDSRKIKRPLSREEKQTVNYDYITKVYECNEALLTAAGVEAVYGWELAPAEYSLTAIFSETIERGGRGYCAVQREPKYIRQQLRIGGETVALCDFKQLHPAILQAQHYGEIRDKDVYNTYVNGLDRDFCKTAVMMILNADAKGIENALYTIYRYYDFKADSYRFATKEKTTKGKTYIPDKHKETAQIVLTPLEGKNKGWLSTSAKDYLNGFIDQHPYMEPFIAYGQSGNLQLLDSQIMRRAIELLNNREIPSLVVHDELIVRERDAEEAVWVMQHAFKEVLNTEVTAPVTIETLGNAP